MRRNHAAITLNQNWARTGNIFPYFSLTFLNTANAYHELPVATPSVRFPLSEFFHQRAVAKNIEARAGFNISAATIKREIEALEAEGSAVSKTLLSPENRSDIAKKLGKGESLQP